MLIVAFTIMFSASRPGKYYWQEDEDNNGRSLRENKADEKDPETVRRRPLEPIDSSGYNRLSKRFSPSKKSVSFRESRSPDSESVSDESTMEESLLEISEDVFEAPGLMPSRTKFAQIQDTLKTLVSNQCILSKQKDILLKRNYALDRQNRELEKQIEFLSTDLDTLFKEIETLRDISTEQLKANKEKYDSFLVDLESKGNKCDDHHYKLKSRIKALESIVGTNYQYAMSPQMNTIQRDLRDQRDQRDY